MGEREERGGECTVAEGARRESGLRLRGGVRERVRVILGFCLYIGDDSGLVWASELGLIYRGGCIIMPSSVNAY